MTSLFGRLLPFSKRPRRVEDLFTEVVARLFERRPDLCVDWLRENDFISPENVSTAEEQHVSVQTQTFLGALEHHSCGSRVDMLIEVRWPGVVGSNGGISDVVLVESKIGSREGEGQLRRLAEHLEQMKGYTRKTLLYVTRAYETVEEEICKGVRGVDFKQLRWHEFHRFLLQAEKDALVEEVMCFMEEEGMARNDLISATDLVALSGLPRVFEIFNETLDAEVKERLATLAGHKAKQEPSGRRIRNDEGYYIYAPLSHDDGLRCYVGYAINVPSGFPTVLVSLDVLPEAEGREATVAAMKQLAQTGEYESYDLDNPDAWAGVYREARLSAFLSGKDDLTKVKQFFLDGITKLEEGLKALKRQHPGLSWKGGT